MSTSIIKIHSGKQNVKQETLVLTVSFLKGKPEEGDTIFLKQHYFSVYPFTITKVKKPLFSDKYEMTLHFPEMEWMWKERIEPHIKETNDTAFCGMSIVAFNNLDNRAKLDYYFSVVDQLGTGRVTDYIKTNYRLGVKLISSPLTAVTGISKFGGLPVTPAGFTFPRDKNGRSALFIGQIHIGELNRFLQATKAFSKEGVLYFFATVKEEDGWQMIENILVKYADAVTGLTEIALPEDLQTMGTFTESGLKGLDEIQIPRYSSSLWKGDEMSEEEKNAYHYLEDILKQYNYVNGTILLGHPNPLQGCVLQETEMKNRKLGWFGESHNWDDNAALQKTMDEAALTCTDWRLLLEIDAMNDQFRKLSNFSGTFNEHSDGFFYLMIRQGDLDKMEFDNTETLYQCT